MNIDSIRFTDPPVHHQFPPLYENLGLPEVSSFIEQKYEFDFTAGKTKRTGHGSIRVYKQSGEFKVIISEKLTGFGPKRLEKLASLLMEEVKERFISNIEDETKPRKVYHMHFGRNDRDK
ncbi:MULTISPECIES: hypothetical protein [Cytobacillus]|uniref:Uncharacterized protein n=3 Tax=Cytobacillus TaxID=2675230 RepID=A0A160M6M0_9BACI|nr:MULTISPECIES: hypothetical protein [Cytobacillus]EFV75212.1 hypothetical protein HMPREF1013_04645 [Bacillus sp. 2_A_57_CT2]MBY0157965.1 hypothetical protein [Cytobacillus firmus]AND38077.1 hypothetical protein A361_02695 [Cytobacillus oceanisediminis 2691]MBU8731244.1 hypothetical protein [Cytobacillus oceanisediminis]MCM3245079.1 hypothetical protein [Cytobacillus oceanisediminis]